MWNLFVGKGRFVEEIVPGDVSRVAKALGALGDWTGIVGLLQSMSTEGGGLLPPLNRLRCVRAARKERRKVKVIPAGFTRRRRLLRLIPVFLQAIFFRKHFWLLDASGWVGASFRLL